MLTDSIGTPAQAGRFATTPVKVDYTATAARSTKLKPNTLYRLYFTKAAFFAFGDVTIVAVANTHTPVGDGGKETHKTDSTNLYVSIVQSAANGSCFITEIVLD